MEIIRTIKIEKNRYQVTISDDTRALQAAFAAGGAIIGVIDSEKPGKSLMPADYVVEDVDDIDHSMLEKVVRRRYGMPWVILETDRLLIREFMLDDPVSEEDVDGDFAEVFTSREAMKAYIENQYPFYGYGMWALVERQSKTIIGKAGIDGEELGYHIYEKYRKKGYGREACQAIIRYAADTLGMERLRLKTRRDNKASIALAESLGFERVEDGLEQVCFFELNSI